MKSIIKFCFVLSILSSQFLGACQNGLSSGSAGVDESLSIVNRAGLNPNIVQEAKSKLLVALDSGNLEVLSGMIIELVINAQAVDVVVYNKKGKPVSCVDLESYLPKAEESQHPVVPLTSLSPQH